MGKFEIRRWNELVVLNNKLEKLTIGFEYVVASPLQWRHNRCDGVSNHQPRDCLLNRLFRRRSKKISKFRVTGLCAGNSPGTGEFPTQMASNAENVSIWWRHHGMKVWGVITHSGPNFNPGLFEWVGDNHSADGVGIIQGSFLLTRFNLNTSMDM